MRLHDEGAVVPRLVVAAKAVVVVVVLERHGVVVVVVVAVVASICLPAFVVGLFLLNEDVLNLARTQSHLLRWVGIPRSVSEKEEEKKKCQRLNWMANI